MFNDDQLLQSNTNHAHQSSHLYLCTMKDSPCLSVTGVVLQRHTAAPKYPENCGICLRWANGVRCLATLHQTDPCFWGLPSWLELSSTNVPLFPEQDRRSSVSPSHWTVESYSIRIVTDTGKVFLWPSSSLLPSSLLWKMSLNCFFVSSQFWDTNCLFWVPGKQKWIATENKAHVPLQCYFYSLFF